MIFSFGAWPPLQIVEVNNSFYRCKFWAVNFFLVGHVREAPDVGLAPSAAWRDLPPFALADPSSSHSPSLPALPLSVPIHPILALSAMLRERAARASVGGEVLRHMGDGGGGPSKRHLGPDPHLGVLDMFKQEERGLTFVGDIWGRFSDPLYHARIESALFRGQLVLQTCPPSFCRFVGKP